MTITLSQIAIVSGNAEIAEHICRHFRGGSCYVVLIEAPMERMEDLGVLANDCAFVVNAIAQCEAKAVLLAGCSLKVESILTSMIVGRVACDLIVFHHISQLVSLPGYNPRPTILQQNTSSERKHIVAVEDGHPMALVIATNLCVATNSEIVVLPHVCRKTQKLINAAWRDWSVCSGMEMNDAKESLRLFLTTQTREVDASRGKTIAFITFGIPYGILEFGVPVSHVPVFPLLGVSLLNGIIKSQFSEMRCPLVVLLDPHATDHSESDYVAQVFGKQGYMIRGSVGAQATVTNARYLTESMPSDAIFYSTHCGEVKGQRVTETLHLDDGTTHTLIYERVITLALGPNPKLVEVIDFKRLISLNGIPWTDEEGKEAIAAGDILRYFMKSWKKSELRVDASRSISVTSCDEVPFSDCLKMFDGHYKPVPNLIGGWLHPIVMNSSCSSSRELSQWFIGKGASCYIGTTRDIPDSMASAVSKKFADTISKGAFVGAALHEAQQTFTSDLGYASFLVYGYQFTRLTVPPTSGKKERIEKMITFMIDGQIESKDQSENHVTQIRSVRAFLSQELAGLQQHFTKQFDP
jgi:hypothetical protein